MPSPVVSVRPHPFPLLRHRVKVIANPEISTVDVITKKGKKFEYEGKVCVSGCLCYTDTYVYDLTNRFSSLLPMVTR